MALTRVSGLSPNVSIAGSVTSDSVTTNLAQIGAATTVHTSGIDLGSGEITSHNIISTGIITAAQFVGDGSLLTGISGDDINDEKKHSGNAFLDVVFEIPDVINVTEDTTLTSLFSESSTMICKRKEVVVNPTKSLTIPPGETFVINAYDL